MKCSKVRDMLMAYVGAELPRDDVERISEHLADCEHCRAELELARKAHAALAVLGEEEPSPVVIGAVRERLAREKLGRQRVFWPRLVAAFSVLLVAALIAAGWFWQNSATRQNVPVARTSESIQTPTQEAQPAPPPKVPTPVVQAPQPGTEKPAPKPAMRPKQRRLVQRTPALRPQKVPPAQKPEVTETVEQPATAEPMMFIALRPREPESYVIHVSSEDEASASELTVVREFDVGGNVTSVTIQETALPAEEPGSEFPVPGESRLMDGPPAGELESENLHSGGYIHHV